MKIYFQNKAARLKSLNEGDYSCGRCPFFRISGNCPWNTSAAVDCYRKGHWIDGESLDIFKV